MWLQSAIQWITSSLWWCRLSEDSWSSAFFRASNAISCTLKYVVLPVWAFCQKQRWACVGELAVVVPSQWAWGSSGCWRPWADSWRLQMRTHCVYLLRWAQRAGTLSLIYTTVYLVEQSPPSHCHPPVRMKRRSPSEKDTDLCLTTDGTMSSLKNVSVLSETMHLSKTLLNLCHLVHHHSIPGIVVASPDKGLCDSHLVRARMWARFAAADPLAAAGRQMLKTQTLPAFAFPPHPQERSAHLPQAHLLLEDLRELLLPLRAVVLVVSSLAFVIPAGDSSVHGCKVMH